MDETKKQPEVVNAAAEQPLDDKALDQVVGGDQAQATTASLYQAVTTGKHFAQPKLVV